MLEPVLRIIKMDGRQSVLRFSGLDPRLAPGSDFQRLPSTEDGQCAFRVKLGTQYIGPIAKSLVWKIFSCCTLFVGVATAKSVRIYC